MINKTIRTEHRNYTIIKEVSVGRDNADLYFCQDDHGQKFVMKYFCSGNPKANIALGKVNHYGRRREGSDLVFNEIKDKSEKHPFIARFYDRVRHEGVWMIFMEYIDGHLVLDFIKNNYINEFPNAVKAVNALGKTLAEWHNNSFSHGDPHLENAILQISDLGVYSVKLIDYSQIHHQDFEYCKSYECFSNDPLRRMHEDLRNYSGKLGHGYITSIEDLQSELNIDNTLVDTFIKSYSSNLNANLRPKLVP